MWPCSRHSGEVLGLVTFWQCNSLLHSAQFRSTSPVRLWLKKAIDLKPRMQQAKNIHVCQILAWQSEGVSGWSTWQICKGQKMHLLQDSACCCQNVSLAPKYERGLVTGDINLPCLLVLQAERWKRRLLSKSPGGSVLIIPVHNCFQSFCCIPK